MQFRTADMSHISILVTAVTRPVASGKISVQPIRSFTADENGIGKLDFPTSLTIDTNPETDILGKVIVIHGGVETDDLAGGTLVSCGVITQ